MSPFICLWLWYYFRNDVLVYILYMRNCSSKLLHTIALYTQSTGTNSVQHFSLLCEEMCKDASMLPCVLLVDSSETDPPCCLQPLIAIIPQWKQSIHPPATPHPTSLLGFLTSSPLLSCFLFDSSLSLPLSIYLAKRCHTGGGVMWFIGGRDKVVQQQ